jgi:hypothetical protein
MMVIVMDICLPVILVPTVPCRWCTHDMDAHPVEKERMESTTEQRPPQHREIVHVLHWVHREASERLWVGVAVMQAMNLPVQKPKVKESVTEVEVDIPPQRNSEDPNHEEEFVAAERHGSRVDKRFE